MPQAKPKIIDLGQIPYDEGYRVQLAHVDEVLAARESGNPDPGRILLLEHDPAVITISRRPGVMNHLTASPEALARAGVVVAQTDRGGDITYHGPGQLVAYPILDLNFYRLGLHDYMRLLESAVIETCGAFGVATERDVSATGVWLTRDPAASVQPPSKICAMGVRVRRWISMHGLALNVTTNLDHFNLIVPCGLAGRSVTSLRQEIGEACPPMPSVKKTLADALVHQLAAARRRAVQETPAAV